MEEPGDRTIAGRYLLGSILGAGGMGVVYRAIDQERGSEVAIKLLHPRHASNPRATQRLGAEGRAGSCVHHPNVVAVLDTGTATNGTPFIVMELVRGQSLDQLIQTAGQLPLRRVAAIGGQILAGLQALHAAGFVHGDVKSGNVLVDSAGGGDAIKLIDLGLARSPDEVDPARGRVASGTPEYMAPEVIRGEGAVPLSDLYAAGVVCYQLLTGTTPFEGGTAREILRRQLDDVVVPPSLRAADRNIPIALDRVVMRALKKEPSERYASAAAFAHALVAATPIIEPAATPGKVRSVFSTSAPTKEWAPQARSGPKRGARGALGPLDARHRRATELLARFTTKTTEPALASAGPRIRSGPVADDLKMS
jgi:serine/threonine-protein kinase